MQTQNSASDIFSAPARALPAKGSGIALRAVTAEDLAALRRAADAEGFGRLTCRPVHTCADADLPARYARVLQDSSTFVCGLYLPGIEHAAGKLTASDYNPRNRSVEIGYYLHPVYRRHGLMKRALTLFCSLLFEHMRLHKVYAQTASFNTASARLLRSVGFQLDGTLRDHHEWQGTLYDDLLFSLLETEFNPK